MDCIQLPELRLVASSVVHNCSVVVFVPCETMRFHEDLRSAHLTARAWRSGKHFILRDKRLFVKRFKLDSLYVVEKYSIQNNCLIFK